MAVTKTPAIPQGPECRIVLQLKYFDPVTETIRTLPAGIVARLVRSTGVPTTLVQGATDASGRVAFPPYRYGTRRVSLQIDFVNEYVNLDTNTLVPAASVALDDRRRLIRMPLLWDSRRQNNLFVDNRGGRFANGILKEVQPNEGTLAVPWIIQVDRAWQRLWVTVRYYNTVSKKEEGIHSGIRLEAYQGNNTAQSNVIGAGTPLNDSGVVYLGIYRPSTPRDQIVVGFRCAADSYFRMDEANLRNRLRVVAAANYSALSMADRHVHYPVPAEWRSSGQWTRFGTGNPRVFRDVMRDANVGLANAKGMPIGFHLDDFVLVENGGAPLGWSASNRFTVFDHALRIRNVDAAHPYWTTNPTSPPGVLQRNAFLADRFFFVAGQGHQQCTRVVAFRRNLHDLVNRRTTQGTIIGARAAVANDHPHQAQRDLWQPAISVRVGNFHLHYFHECMSYDYAGEGALPLSHVLVHWATRFQRRDGATAADEQTYRQQYLPEAERRLTGVHPGLTGPAETKAYVLQEHSAASPAPTPPRRIMVRHFLEARDDSHVHCTTRIHRNGSARAGMALDECDLYLNDSGPTSTVGIVNTPHDFRDQVDHDIKGRFTAAHEIGHALGLADEYPEPMMVPLPSADDNWVEPRLPQFHQQYPGIHYSCDFRVGTLPTGQHSHPGGRPLMFSNQLLRMRVHWPRLNWLNHYAPVQQLLGGRAHEVTYHIQTGPMTGSTIRYLLPTDHENPYRRVANAANLANPPGNPSHGRMNLHLYKIGQDELAHHNVSEQLQNIDSILVVALNLHWSFITQNGSPGWGANSDWTARRQVMQDFERGGWDVTRRLNAFVANATTSIPADNDLTRPAFRRCFLYFRPFYARASTAGSHFQIRVRRAHLTNAALNVADIDNPAFSGTTINILDSTPPLALLRYCLGLPAVNPIPATGPIAAAELTFLATWLQAQLGRAYVIQRI